MTASPQTRNYLYGKGELFFRAVGSEGYDHLGNAPAFTISLTEEKLESIRMLNEIAKERGESLAQMALKWVLKDHVVTSVLIGASKPSQILDNLKVLESADFTEEELKTVKGEFTPSKFVKKITGVDNVCERSAVLASGNGSLIRKKTGREGVTTALGLRKWEVHFE